MNGDTGTWTSGRILGLGPGPAAVHDVEHGGRNVQDECTVNVCESHRNKDYVP